MTGTSSEFQPVTVVHDSESRWFPRSISVTFNNDKVLVIRPNMLAGMYWEPKGVAVDEENENKLEYLMIEARIQFRWSAEWIDSEANEILDVLEPGMMDLTELVKQVQGEEEEEDNQGAETG